MSAGRWAAALAVLGATWLGPTTARALPTETVVFLNSNQALGERAPELALFSFYFARKGVSLLGLYAGPRFKFGDLGLEAKVGAYGGTATARAIVNNQIDYVKKHLSLCVFTDFYPTDEVYSYASAYFVAGPLYVGGVGDIDHSWAKGAGFTTYGGGPAVGLGTKAMYVATGLVFKHDATQAVRLTLGLTL